MILQLNPEAFRHFGTILPENSPRTGDACGHRICLFADSTSLYRAEADTRLWSDKGLTLVSVSADGERFRDFYLDKPIIIRQGIFFALTAFESTSAVCLAGGTPPQLIQIRPAQPSPATLPEVQVTKLYTIFYQEKEQGFLFPGEAHSMLELTYVERGTLHSVVDGMDLTLQQGDMALYGPGQWHMQYADIGVAPRYVTISFQTGGCDLGSLYNRCLTPPRSVLTLLQQILREYEQPQPYSTDIIVHLLELLLLGLLRQSEAPTGKPQAPHSLGSENEIIRRAQQYIGAHVREKLSVPLVARQTDVSASYLTALFHKHLQISPGEYIRRIKLQESKQLIREGSMNFTEISQALQYSTVHHFSRQFKEKFGITPTEYAKSVK